AWLAGTASAVAAGSGSPPSAVYHSLRSVVVQPGESLWTIAAQADPAGDPRSVMQEIIDINALHGMSGQPGPRLLLPRGSPPGARPEPPRTRPAQRRCRAG